MQLHRKCNLFCTVCDRAATSWYFRGVKMIIICCCTIFGVEKGKNDCNLLYLKLSMFLKISGWALPGSPPRLRWAVEWKVPLMSAKKWRTRRSSICASGRYWAKRQQWPCCKRWLQALKTHSDTASDVEVDLWEDCRLNCVKQLAR